MVLCLSCAGDLRNPDRFEFLLDSSAPSDAGNADGAQSSGDAATEGPPMTPTCATDLFKMKCNQMTCHGPGAPILDLVSPGMETRVIGKSSPNSQACTDRVLVTTDGSPSLLIQKLQDPPPCGSKMPLIGTVTAAERMCLSDWVDAVGKGGT
jgi:hypothetical protein